MDIGSVEEGAAQANLRTTATFDAPLKWETIELEIDVYGEGAEYVYAYYFPFQKATSLKLGRRTWPIKIGAASKSVPRRIAKPYKTVTIFEAPVVGFWAQCEKCETLEKALKETFQHVNLKKKGAKNVGTEWFDTNFAQIRRAYREIEWKGFRNFPRRLYHRFRMEAAARQLNHKTFGEFHGDTAPPFEPD